jgi:hypothetical protein
MKPGELNFLFRAWTEKGNPHYVCALALSGKFAKVGRMRLAVHQLRSTNSMAPSGVPGANSLWTVSVLPLAKACLRRTDVKTGSHKRDCKKHYQYAN